jgi:hypothetical protein
MSTVSQDSRGPARDIASPDPRRWRGLAVLAAMQFMLVLDSSASTGQFISVDPALAQTLQPYQYANANPISNTDPTGQYLNGYAYCSGGWYGYCDLFLDWYASKLLIEILERMDIWWDACKEITEKVFSGRAADILNILCNVFGGITVYIADYLKYRWSFCGGERNYYSGLYLHGDWWRIRYWLFGWRWGARHYYYGWAACWYFY